MESQETLANLQKFLTLLDPSLNLSEMLTNVARQLVEMFNVDHSGMLLFGPEDTTGEVIAEYPPQGAVGLTVPLTEYPLLTQLKAEQKTIAIFAAQTDPLMGSARATMRRLGIESILIIPLVVRGKIVGSLSLDSISRPREFTRQELDLCQVIGNQIAVAVDYTFALADVEASHRRAQTLREINRNLSQSLNLDEVLQMILEQLEKVLPVSGSSIFLRVTDGVQLRAWRGRRKPLSTDDIIPLEKLWGASEIFSRQVAVLIPNTREHPHWTAGKDDAIECWLGVPLMVRGQVVGILNIDGYTPHQFNQSHVPLATDFANQAAIAIHNAELYGQVANRAELFRSIQEIGVSIVASLDLEEVLRTVSSSIVELLEAQHIRIYLYDAAEDHLTLASSLDNGGNLTMGVRRIPPRADGLTARVARSGAPLVIPDTRQHPLYRQRSGYTHFQAIVGMPLKKREQVQGVMTVAYRERHYFTTEELDGLQLLALQTAVALENARLYALEVKQIEQELSIARQIQQGFLPQNIPHIPGWEISAVCLPARETGGDFYEFVQRRDSTWGLAVGDVSGKSIQAAMLMGAAQSVVASKGSDHRSPAVVITETNRLLYEDVPPGSFVAVSYALVSAESNEVCLSNGGQLAPYFVPYSDEQPIRLIEPPGSHWPVGVLENVTYQEVSLKLNSGDLLVFFTDGLVERMDAARRIFGFEGVAATLESVRGRPTSQVIHTLLHAADEFANQRRAHDDVTLLVMRRLENYESGENQR